QVAELAKQMKIPNAPAPLEMLKAKLGIRKSLDEKGSVVVAALPSPTEDGEPIIIAYVPVTDYKEFLQELKANQGEGDITEVEAGNLVAARKGAFAVLAQREHREALKQALARGGVAASIGALQTWLDENNAAGLLTTNGVKLLTTKMQAGLDKIKNGIPDDTKPETKAARATFDMIDTFVKNVQGSVTT